jgi:hypothetical protein
VFGGVQYFGRDAGCRIDCTVDDEVYRMESRGVSHVPIHLCFSREPGELPVTAGRARM